MFTTMTVKFRVEVPDGTHADKLSLHIPYKVIPLLEIHSTGDEIYGAMMGYEVYGATINDYETVLIEVDADEDDSN